MRPKLIAITGGSGAGKSWLADKLEQLFEGQAQRLCLDAFYLDRSHLTPQSRARINYDHPRCIDWSLAAATLQQLKLGRPVQLPCYDFATHCRTPGKVSMTPKPVVLIEGLWLLHRPVVRRLFDLAIFLDCPATQRLRWRIARDTIERGRTEQSVRTQFRSTVAPMHKLWVAPQREHADVVLRQPLKAKDIDNLFERLWALLADDVIYPDTRRHAYLARARTLISKEGI